MLTRSVEITPSPAPATAPSARLQNELKSLRARLSQTEDELEAALQKIARLECHRGWRWRQLLRKCVGVRLGVLKQYRPRPLGLPRHYGQTRSDATLSFGIVTPSYNQGDFLEQTMHSVLEQDYPRLDYIVHDNLSQDETPKILERYRNRLTHCAQEKDQGQADAINRGFAHTRAEVMAYLNSDDLLLPGTLHYVSSYFERHPEIDVVYGHRIVVDEAGDEIGRWILPRHDDAVLSWADYVPQETLFWRRRVWERVGAALDLSFQFALDWDLLLRFRDAGARFARLPRFLGAFRFHAAQKTTSQIAHQGLPEMNRLRERCHGRPVSYTEIARKLSGYLCRHVTLDTLYRFGILRY
ncbi:MAG: glycosyltransferase family 2 protein [Gemmataceae bacterium]